MRARTPLLLVVPALAAGVAGGPTPVAGAQHGPCARAAALRPGPTAGAYYATAAPFEHASSARTQLFPATCSTSELPGRGPVRVRARRAPGTFRTPYVAATRGRRQLFAYGYGVDAARDGGYVAALDARSLRVRWRTRLPDADPPGQWSYPGVLAVHGNGRLYAVYGNVLAKLDAATGTVLRRRELPEDPDGTGAAYNGLIILPDGRIAAKRIERGPCATPPADPLGPATGPALAGLTCAGRNGLPTPIVVVEPARLRVVASVVPPEPVTGRITFGRVGGRGHLYAAGRDTLFRFRYGPRGRLALDRGWGPVPYRSGAQRPGTGPGLLGGFLVVQTNFLPSAEPLTVTAVSVRDSRRVFRIRPFADAGAGSWIVSKPALDAATATVVTHDTQAGRMAALHLDARRGFTVRWRRALHALDFAALVGGARRREVVVPDLTPSGDRVRWLDERTGRTTALSGPLASGPAPGNIVTPGFDGRFYYLSVEGRLWELRPTR